MIHMPLGVEAQMSDVRLVLVAVLLDGHLLYCVRPRVEVDLAALVVERKVAHLDEAARVQAYLGHPRDHACM